MKRRDFVTKFLSASTCTLGAVVLGVPFRGKAAKSHQILSKCGEKSLCISKNIISLPKSPEVYKTTFNIEVTSKALPTIIGNGELIECQEEEFQITKPGKYTLQYLGPFYGWSVS
jgi:hypothetical protein